MKIILETVYGEVVEVIENSSGMFTIEHMEKLRAYTVRYEA